MTYTTQVKAQKKFWDTLEQKYSKDEGIKRFKASYFLKFKMVYGNPMNDQIHLKTL